MSLIVAIQMDPIEAIDIDADSTFIMAWRPGLEAIVYITICRRT